MKAGIRNTFIVTLAGQEARENSMFVLAIISEQNFTCNENNMIFRLVKVESCSRKLAGST
jgi:hypothetical protein